MQFQTTRQEQQQQQQQRCAPNSKSIILSHIVLVLIWITTMILVLVTIDSTGSNNHNLITAFMTVQKITPRSVQSSCRLSWTNILLSTSTSSLKSQTMNDNSESINGLNGSTSNNDNNDDDNNESKDTIIARRIIVKGDVQGGYYRACVLNEAGKFRRLVGTMSPIDTSSDTAEIYVEGKQNMVEGFIRWCQRSKVGLNQIITVQNIYEEEPTGMYDDFYTQTTIQ